MISWNLPPYIPKHCQQRCHQTVYDLNSGKRHNDTAQTVNAHIFQVALRLRTHGFDFYAPHGNGDQARYNDRIEDEC